MANDYATLAELKILANVTVTKFDVGLQSLLDAAAAAIDRFCRRPGGFVGDGSASTRYYSGDGSDVLRIDECVAVSAVAIKESVSDDEDDYTTWTVGTVGTTTEADVFPASGDSRTPEFNRLPYTMLVIGPNGDYSAFTSGRVGKMGFPTAKITAKWGYAEEAPDDITTATIMQATRWFKRLQGGMSDTLLTGELGQLMFTRRLDPDVTQILVQGGYRRMAVG